jgi:hemolysin activation/secretion protein
MLTMTHSLFLPIALFVSITSFVHAESVTDPLIAKPLNEHSFSPPRFQDSVTPDFKLPALKENLLPTSLQQGTISLKAVRFVGNTVFDDETLSEISKPYLGRNISITELEQLRLAISKHYSDKGYVNSGAILNVETFVDGVVQMDIIEGTLTDIRVTGNDRLQAHYIADRLALGSQEHFNINNLQDRFQLLLQDPLIQQMNTQLRPGTQLGESILEVDVIRARPYQLSLGFNNDRPPSVGSDQGILSGWVQNLTTLGDKFSGSLTYGEGSLGASGEFSIPLNAYDTRFHFRFDINDSSIIEEPLEELAIESKYMGFETGITHPILKTLNRHFNIGINFAYKENKTTLSGDAFSFSEGAENGVTQDSVLRFTLDFTERLSNHIFSARSVTRVGLNTLDATWHHDDRADGDFVAWLGQLQYAGKILDTNGVLILRGNMQYADEKLLPLERFSLGGRHSIRGYRQNEIVRDKGFTVSAEVRYALFKEAANFPGNLTLFSFMDYGGGWNHGEKEDIAYLHSMGVGVEWQPVKYFHTEVVYAHDLNQATEKAEYNLQDSGLHWQFTLFAF